MIQPATLQQCPSAGDAATVQLSTAQRPTSRFDQRQHSKRGPLYPGWNLGCTPAAMTRCGWTGAPRCLPPQCPGCHGPGEQSRGFKRLTPQHSRPFTVKRFQPPATCLSAVSGAMA